PVAIDDGQRSHAGLVVGRDDELAAPGLGDHPDGEGRGAGAAVPYHLSVLPADDLSARKSAVALDATSDHRAIPGETLDADAGELAHDIAARQLADQGRRAAVRATGPLLGDVSAIVARDPAGAR